MTNHDPLNEFANDFPDAEVSYPDDQQHEFAPQPDIEAPFVWNVKLNAVAGTILTVRGNTAEQLHDRINDLLDYHVSDIIERTMNLDMWSRSLTSNAAPKQSTNRRMDTNEDRPAKPASKVRMIDYRLADGEEDVFDAVKMSVTIHKTKGTPVLNLWDRNSVNEKYAPCQVYFKPEGMAKLFDDREFDASDFTNAREFFVPAQRKARAVVYTIVRKGDKTFVNAKSIGPERDI